MTPELKENVSGIASHSLLGEVRDFIRQANGARAEYERAASIYAGLAFVESKLEADRHGVKEVIVKRLMDGPDPATDEKPFGGAPGLSATAAEKAAHTDAAYLAHLKLQRETVRDKNNAFTRMESARMRVEIAVASVRALGGIS